VTSARRRPTWKRIVGIALGIGVLVAVFGFVLPRFANYSDVWRQFRSMNVWWLLALLVVEVLNLVTYAPNFMVALPGLRFRQSLELQFTGTALSNVAPLGGAVSIGWQYRMMKAWGFTASASSRAMVVTGVWNNLVNLGLPVVALTILTIGGGRNAALMLAAEIGAALFVVILGGFLLILANDTGARLIGQVAENVINVGRRILRRPTRRTMADTMVRFRRDSTELLKRQWFWLTVWTVIGTLTLFGVLMIIIRAIGINGDQVTVTEAFAAWSLTRLLSAIPITPGGIGILDVGLAGALKGFGGNDAKVVAVVLLFRVIAFVPPIVLGALAMFTWKRHPERHQPPE
jgi:uncharacterized protein (TIRG00374 family)